MLVTPAGWRCARLCCSCTPLLDGSSVWLLYAVVAVQAAHVRGEQPGADGDDPTADRPRAAAGRERARAGDLGLGFTVGPLLAGALVGTVGYEWAYGVDVVAFMAALYAVLRLPPIPPEVEEGAVPAKAGLASVLEGLRYLRTRKNVLMTFLVDLNAMVFGMPRALFPAVAGVVLRRRRGNGRDPVCRAARSARCSARCSRAGWAESDGKGSRSSSRSSRGARSIAAFGFTRTLWLGVLFLAVAGAADMVSAVYRSTILQVATPDEMRGRLQGVFIVVVAGGPRLGDVESGTVAEVTNEAFSIVSGGLLCIAGVAVLCALYPRFLKYDARHPEA